MGKGERREKRKYTLMKKIKRKRAMEGRFFFFKRKTAYEVLRSLVGAEMCISDGTLTLPVPHAPHRHINTTCPSLLTPPH